jgi:hypothetical protein
MNQYHSLLLKTDVLVTENQCPRLPKTNTRTRKNECPTLMKKDQSPERNKINQYFLLMKFINSALG